jgi:hypothetical protein
MIYNKLFAFGTNKQSKTKGSMAFTGKGKLQVSLSSINQSAGKSAAGLT